MYKQVRNWDVRLVLQALIRIFLSLIFHKKYIRKEKNIRIVPVRGKHLGLGTRRRRAFRQLLRETVEFIIPYKYTYQVINQSIALSINKCLIFKLIWSLSFLFLDFDLMHLLWCRKTVFIALTFRHVFNHSLVWPTPKPG